MATVALTYEQIGQRLGITVPSVRRMVNRHRWRKARANDGRTLVSVPEEYLAAREAAPMPGLEAAPEAAPVPALEADLVARLAALQADLVEMARRAGAAEALVEALIEDRNYWRTMFEKVAQPAIAPPASRRWWPWRR